MPASYRPRAARVGTARNALAGHDLRRLASVSRRRDTTARYDTEVFCWQSARKRPKTCNMQHNRISVTLIRSLGRPRAGAVPGVELAGGRAQWLPCYTKGGDSALRRARFVRAAETREPVTCGTMDIVLHLPGSGRPGE
jgi:hypothetical protein